MDNNHGPIEANEGADLENEPAAVEPEQKMTLEEEMDWLLKRTGDPEAPDEERRIRATKMLVRHSFFQVKLADVWREFNPNTTASHKSCIQQASVEIRWLNKTYPLDLGLLLEIHGMGDSALLEELQRYMHATTLIKSGVKRKIDPDTGRVVSEEYQFIEVRDNRAWGDAIQKWMTIMGYKLRREPPKEVKDMPVTQRHVTPEQLAPDASKSAATTIAPVEKLSNEEVEKRLADYLARKRRARAQQSDEDLLR